MTSLSRPPVRQRGMFSDVPAPCAWSGLRTFVSALHDDPLSIGALVPSSASLARAMARQVPVDDSGTVVELGPGSGAITAALLERGIAPQRLYLVERNPALTDFLRRRFPGIRVAENDAGRLSSLVRRDGIGRVSAVVSSIPLRNLDARVRYALLSRVFDALDPSGLLIQYTYHYSAPLTREMERRLGVVAECAGYVWSNIPPASVWRLRRISAARAPKGSRAA